MLFNGFRRARTESGVALVLVLSLMALMAVVCVAFLVYSSKQVAISNQATSLVQAPEIAELAVNQFVQDIQREIKAGSVIPDSSRVKPELTATVLYPATPQSAVPDRSSAVGDRGASDASASPLTAPNLVKQSAYGAKFYNDQALSPSGVPVYPRAEKYPVAPRASNLSTSPTAAGGNTGAISGGISDAKWNRPLLLPRASRDSVTDFSPLTSGTVRSGGEEAQWKWKAPDWVFVTKNGSTPSDIDSKVAEARTNGKNPVTARYAYQVYDIGGLLDLNVAGYNPSETSADVIASRRGSQAFANLGVLGFEKEHLEKLIQYRNPLTSANSTSAKIKDGFPFQNRYANYVFSGSLNLGFLRVANDPDNAKALSNRAFSSRLSMMDFVKSLAADDAAKAQLLNSMEFLTHYSRSLEQPSYFPGFFDANSDPEKALFIRPTIVPPAGKVDDVLYPFTISGAASGDQVSLAKSYPGGTLINSWDWNSGVNWPGIPYCWTIANNRGGNDKWGIYDDRTPAGSSSIDKRSLQDMINPGFLEIRVPMDLPKNTLSRRMDGSRFVPGEPLVKKRFPLERLAWLTFKGPSAEMSSSDSSNLYNPAGTSEAIKKSFGLIWTTDSRTGAKFWVYNPEKDESNPMPRIRRLEELAKNDPDNGFPREPNFFEILNAAVAAGSLGKSALQDLSTNDFMSPSVYNHMRDRNTDYQVFTIGANIIDQYDTDSFPTVIKMPLTKTDKQTIQATDSLNPPLYVARGVENLPYLYRLHWRGVRSMDSRFAEKPALKDSPYEITQEITDNYEFKPGVVFVMGVPELWNPHAAPVDDRSGKEIDPTVKRDQKFIPTAFRAVADSATPEALLDEQFKLAPRINDPNYERNLSDAISKGYANWGSRVGGMFGFTPEAGPGLWAGMGIGGGGLKTTDTPPKTITDLNMATLPWLTPKFRNESAFRLRNYGNGNLTAESFYTIFTSTSSFRRDGDRDNRGVWPIELVGYALTAGIGYKDDQSLANYNNKGGSSVEYGMFGPTGSLFWPFLPTIYSERTIVNSSNGYAHVTMPVCYSVPTFNVALCSITQPPRTGFKAMVATDALPRTGAVYASLYGVPSSAFPNPLPTGEFAGIPGMNYTASYNTTPLVARSPSILRLGVSLTNRFSKLEPSNALSPPGGTFPDSYQAVPQGVAGGVPSPTVESLWFGKYGYDGMNHPEVPSLPYAGLTAPGLNVMINGAGTLTSGHNLLGYRPGTVYDYPYPTPFCPDPNELYMARSFSVHQLDKPPGSDPVLQAREWYCTLKGDATDPFVIGEPTLNTDDYSKQYYKYKNASETRGSEIWFSVANTTNFREPTPLCWVGQPQGADVKSGPTNFFRAFNGGVADKMGRTWTGFSLGEVPLQTIWISKVTLGSRVQDGRVGSSQMALHNSYETELDMVTDLYGRVLRNSLPYPTSLTPPVSPHFLGRGWDGLGLVGGTAHYHPYLVDPKNKYGYPQGFDGGISILGGLSSGTAFYTLTSSGSIQSSYLQNTFHTVAPLALDTSNTPYLNKGYRIRLFSAPTNLAGPVVDSQITVRLQYKAETGGWITYDEKFLFIPGNTSAGGFMSVVGNDEEVIFQAAGNTVPQMNGPSGWNPRIYYPANTDLPFGVGNTGIGSPSGSDGGPMMRNSTTRQPGFVKKSGRPIPWGNPVVTSYDPRTPRFGNPSRGGSNSHAMVSKKVPAYTRYFDRKDFPESEAQRSVLNVNAGLTDRPTAMSYSKLDGTGDPFGMCPEFSVPTGITRELAYDNGLNVWATPNYTAEKVWKGMTSLAGLDGSLLRPRIVGNLSIPVPINPKKWFYVLNRDPKTGSPWVTQISLNSYDYGWMPRLYGNGAPAAHQGKGYTIPSSAQLGKRGFEAVPDDDWPNFLNSTHDFQGGAGIFDVDRDYGYDGDAHIYDALRTGSFSENVAPSVEDPYAQAYADPDDVVRRAMGGYAYEVDKRAGKEGLPLAQGTSTSDVDALQNRPVILDRPFRSVAELGYAFRGTPWKNVCFSMPESGDAALLDVFCLSEVPALTLDTTENPPVPEPSQPLMAGKLNLNTRQAPVLKALLEGALKDERDFSSRLTEDMADLAAQALVDRTTGKSLWNGPLTNVSELVGKLFGKNLDETSVKDPSVYNSFVPKTSYWGTQDPKRNTDMDSNGVRWSFSGLSSDLVHVFKDPKDLKTTRLRESVLRALADSGQTRVWNLMVDLIVQNGRLPAGATSLAQFSKEGEGRVWVYLAIDRFTGEILDKQAEWVPE